MEAAKIDLPVIIQHLVSKTAVNSARLTALQRGVDLLLNVFPPETLDQTKNILRDIYRSTLLKEQEEIQLLDHFLAKRLRDDLQGMIDQFE